MGRKGERQMKLSEKILLTATAFTGAMAYAWAVTLAASILHTPPAVVVCLLGAVVIIWHRAERWKK